MAKEEYDRFTGKMRLFPDPYRLAMKMDLMAMRINRAVTKKGYARLWEYEARKIRLRTQSGMITPMYLYKAVKALC